MKTPNLVQHINLHDVKCEKIKAWVQQYCFKKTLLLESIWSVLVGRNSSTRNKIIKVGTQTDVRDFCARTLLFLEVVWLRSVSKSTIWNFSTMDFAPKFCFILKKRILGFASFLLPFTFYDSREKQPAEFRINTKKKCAHLGFCIVTVENDVNPTQRWH